MSGLLLLLACGSGRFDGERAALRAWEQGVAALERGDAVDAAQRFAEASVADPNSPEPFLWRGRALAAAGDLDGAIAAADEALRLRPDWSLALYNRGCWRLRSGSVELAWTDLAPALASGELDPLALAADPDLAPLRADPRFAGRVPAAELPAELSLPPEPQFLGSDLVLTVRVLRRPDTELTLELQGLEGLPLSLRRVVETVERAGDTQRQTVEFDLKVEGAAQGALGPTLLRAGSLERRVDAMPFTLLAPEGHQPALLPPLGEQLRVPSTQFSGLPERGGARQGDWLLVRGLPGDQVRWLGEPTRVYSVEVREGNNPSWVGWGAWGTPLGAVLLRQGAELWRLDP